MYADAGDRTRTYRVTIQDDPTTPQRHTFTKTGITTIYDTNRLVTSADIWRNSVLQEKWSEPFRNKQNEGVKNVISKIQTWISTPIKFSMYRNAFIKERIDKQNIWWMFMICWDQRLKKFLVKIFLENLQIIRNQFLFKFLGFIVRIERCVSRICMTLRWHRGSNPGLPHGSQAWSHDATTTYI